MLFEVFTKQTIYPLVRHFPMFRLLHSDLTADIGGRTPHTSCTRLNVFFNSAHNVLPAIQS